MEFIIAGMICFSKEDTDSMCLPFEQKPLVIYRSIEKCTTQTEKIKINLRKKFNKEGFLVDQLIVACLKNPHKSNA